MTEKKPHSEEFKVNGDDLLNKVKQIINEGNVRRIIIKDKSGKSLIELPVTIGVIGAVFAPALAAVGALAALVTECSITVIREHDESDANKKTDEPTTTKALPKP